MMAKEYRRLLSHLIFVQRRCWNSLQGRIFGIHKNDILNMLNNFDDETEVTRQKYNPHWLQISDIINFWVS